MNKIPDWLIVDHYALDERWEKHLRASVSRIFIIDDLVNRVYNCDVLLDQNLVEGMETRYDDKALSSCGKILGPEYPLLQLIYTELYDRIPHVKDQSGEVRFFAKVERNNLFHIVIEEIIFLKRFISKK
ncbi:hypothetical protein ACKUB1_07545 [Methanospirillum stamsii]|uniref:Uncharacterized protein n=1 Tax=Methanospirillum stamsii TaxID=1277351 RepID=A0A2V2MN10_9EURY|nr:hypothetical protein [Methanospirillum stamsii]PWR69634.1 hypothetical protein DLD82_17325 [Methanospirillum stamsii]